MPLHGNLEQSFLFDAMNKNRQSVSVVIIAYNERHNIGRAIRSVQCQTYKDIEIVVVDDCSVDGTAAVVERIAAKDSRIVLHRLPHNHGMQHARIIGTHIASSPYIAFLDADDTFQPEAIASLYKKITETGVDVVEMASRHAINRLPLYIDMHIPSMHLDKDVYDRDLIELLLSGKISANVWTKMYRRTVVERTGMQPTGHVLGEDVIFNLRVLSQASGFAWIDYRGVNYRSKDANLIRLRRWEELKKMYLYLFSSPVVNVDRARLGIIAGTAVDDLIENIALQLMNPFRRKKAVLKWIGEELASGFWDNVVPYLDDNYRWFGTCDADMYVCMSEGKARLRRNRRNYLLFYFLDIFG